MNKILSISVASYNSSNVIKDCLNSIVKSKYIDLIEVLVIDDGSKDDTAEIVKRYEDLYPKSIILIKKENGGYGSTVNMSLSKATGKYFKTVEGDDWLNTNGLDKLIEYLKSSDVDIVINDYEEIIANNKKYINANNGHIYNRILNFKEINKKQIFRIQSITVNLKILKLVEYKISEHRFYVDSEYVFLAMIYAKNMIFLQDIVYQYRLGQDGQSVSINSIYNHFDDLMYIIDNLLKIYSEIESKIKDDYKKKYLLKNINVLYTDLYHWFSIMKSMDKYKELEIFDRNIKEKYSKYINTMDFGYYKYIKINYYIFLKLIRGLKTVKNIIR